MIGSVSKYDFEMQDMMFTREAHVLTDGLEGYGVTIETLYRRLVSMMEARSQRHAAQGGGHTLTHTGAIIEGCTPALTGGVGVLFYTFAMR